MREQQRKHKAKRKTDTTIKSRRLKVDYLARVEGEGALYVKIKHNEVKDVQFKIFEPTRFYEAFLQGRSYLEPPDITARICGICPVAYQMSSVHAIEMACGVEIGGPIRELRRLIYCGEWIESHVLHAYMLHAPDFLGYESALHIAKDLPEVVKKALELKKIGNELVTLLGGREIHPISVRIGGFYRVPKKKELNWNGRARHRSTLSSYLRRLTFRISSRITSTYPFATQTNIRSTRDVSSPTRESTSTSAISTPPFRNITSIDRTRCKSRSVGEAPIMSDHWLGTA